MFLPLDVFLLKCTAPRPQPYICAYCPHQCRFEGLPSGSFLVRPSESVPGCFGLDVKCGHQMRHFLIAQVRHDPTDVHGFILCNSFVLGLSANWRLHVHMHISVRVCMHTLGHMHARRGAAPPRARPSAVFPFLSHHRIAHRSRPVGR